MNKYKIGEEVRYIKNLVDLSGIDEISIGYTFIICRVDSDMYTDENGIGFTEDELEKV